jgi:hypothetical protein
MHHVNIYVCSDVNKKLLTQEHKSCVKQLGLCECRKKGGALRNRWPAEVFSVCANTLLPAWMESHRPNAAGVLSLILGAVRSNSRLLALIILPSLIGFSSFRLLQHYRLIWINIPILRYQ